jgi:hypothetical protein
MELVLARKYPQLISGLVVVKTDRTNIMLSVHFTFRLVFSNRQVINHMQGSRHIAGIPRPEKQVNVFPVIISATP